MSPGDAANYTLTLRNTGKVAITAGGAISRSTPPTSSTTPRSAPCRPASPSPATRSPGRPGHRLAATSSVTIPFTVNPAKNQITRNPDRRRRGDGTLTGIARAATLGSTCLACTTTHTIGNGPISPAVTGLTGGTPTVGVPLTADTSGWAAGHDVHLPVAVDGTPVPGATSATYTPDQRRRRAPRRRPGDRPADRVQPDHGDQSALGRRCPGHPDRRHPADHLGHAQGRRAARRRPRHVGAGHRTSPTSGAPTAPTSPLPTAAPDVLTPAAPTQVGQTIDVVVTGTKAGYTTPAKTSAATAAVVAGDPISLTRPRSSPARPRWARRSFPTTARGTTVSPRPSRGPPTASTSAAPQAGRTPRPRPSSARRSPSP